MTMSMSIISFTDNGIQLSKKIAGEMGDEEIDIFTKYTGPQDEQTFSSVHFVEERIGEWAGEQMKSGNTMLFIGACGIAVRAIAPCVANKLQDSPVLVMDEKGDYVIPILSGHFGGANEIAERIADRIGAVPVITTATDINGKFAVDLFAKRNGLYIVNRDGIAKVSSKVLSGKEITVSVEPGHMEEAGKRPKEIRMVTYPPGRFVDIVITAEQKAFEAAITLRPREYVVGMGCRKGKEREKIEALIQKSIESAGISESQLFALASIEQKKTEEGFLAWSRKTKIPFLTYTAEQLQDVEGDFRTSVFVYEKVGVDNVCERAALKACGGGKLIYKKHAEDGMTIAIAKREWRVAFDEEQNQHCRNRAR